MKRYRPSQIPMLVRLDLPAYRKIIRPEEVTKESQEIYGRAVSSGNSLAEEALLWMHENIELAPDKERFGRPDYWLTPRQTIESGAGDCEDFVGVFISIMLNFGADDLVMVIGVNEGEDHAWAVGTDESTGVSYLIDAVYNNHIFNVEDTTDKFEPAIYIGRYGFLS